MQETILVQQNEYCKAGTVRVDENSYMTNDDYDNCNDYADRRSGDRKKHNGYGIVGFDENNYRHLVDVDAVKNIELRRIAIENAIAKQKKMLEKFVDFYYSNYKKITEHKEPAAVRGRAMYAQRIINRFADIIETYEIMLYAIKYEIQEEAKSSGQGIDKQ
jgi:hypothetical protein